VRASRPLDRQVKFAKMTYTHLTQSERYQIEILCKAGHKQNSIARLMGRDKSCISRELRRNRDQRGYRKKQAHSLAQSRKLACLNGPRVDAKTWAVVDSKLNETWSPQQISGYLLVNKQPGVSHESIYQRIYADKRKGGTLHLTLRCQKYARNAIPDVPEGAASPIKSRLTCAQPSWPSVPALVTGRPTWS
jgi:IS30 family transposase